MDRNDNSSASAYSIVVALHPEGVDRNHRDAWNNFISSVALHPEGVDRNFLFAPELTLFSGSPSTRRAWIEISSALDRYLLVLVALHPEGVDRNTKSPQFQPVL